MPIDLAKLSAEEFEMKCSADAFRKGTIWVGIQDLVIGLIVLIAVVNTVIIEQLRFPMFGQYLEGDDIGYGWAPPPKMAAEYAKRNISENPCRIQYLVVGIICLTTGFILGSIFLFLGSCLERTWLLKCWLYPNYAMVTAQVILLIVCASIFTLSPFALIFSPTIVYRGLLVWTVHVYNMALSQLNQQPLNITNDVENTTEIKTAALNAENKARIKSDVVKSGSASLTKNPQNVEDTNKMTTKPQKRQAPKPEQVSSTNTATQPRPMPTRATTSNETREPIPPCDPRLTQQCAFSRTSTRLVRVTGINPQDIGMQLPPIFSGSYQHTIPFPPRRPQRQRRPRQMIPTPPTLTAVMTSTLTSQRLVQMRPENTSRDLDWDTIVRLGQGRRLGGPDESDSSDNDVFEEAETWE